MDIETRIYDLCYDFAEADERGFYFKAHMIVEFAKQFALDTLHDKSIQDELFNEEN